MKIDIDLRNAIKSAAKGWPDEDTWETRWQARKDAIAALMEKKPEIKAAIFDARQKHAEARKLLNELEAKVEAYGIKFSLDGFDDEKAFVSSGGEIPPVKTKKFQYDKLIAMLAAAKTIKEFDAILESHNINWK